MSAPLYHRPDSFRLPGTLPRLWVGLRVTQADIDRGYFAGKPGLYLFSGMWYGDDPTDKRSFGKMVPLACGSGAVRVGTVSRRSPPSILRRLDHEGRPLRPRRKDER